MPLNFGTIDSLHLDSSRACTWHSTQSPCNLLSNISRLRGAPSPGETCPKSPAVCRPCTLPAWGPGGGWYPAQLSEDRAWNHMKLSLLFFNHPTSAGTMNYWLCTVQNFPVTLTCTSNFTSNDSILETACCCIFEQGAGELDRTLNFNYTMKED